jgi:hypothetical protein
MSATASPITFSPAFIQALNRLETGTRSQVIKVITNTKSRFGHLRPMTGEALAQWEAWRKQRAVGAAARRAEAEARAADPRQLAAEAAPIVEQMKNVYDFCIQNSRHDGRRLNQLERVTDAAQSMPVVPGTGLSRRARALVERAAKFYRGDTTA